jgi:hypothetical protein
MRRRNAVGKGELYVIPYVPSDNNGTSAQPSPSIVFHEACFKIIDPQCEKEDGDVLLFGDEVCVLHANLIVHFNVHCAAYILFQTVHAFTLLCCFGVILLDSTQTVVSSTVHMLL